MNPSDTNIDHLYRNLGTKRWKASLTGVEEVIKQKFPDCKIEKVVQDIYIWHLNEEVVGAAWRSRKDGGWWYRLKKGV